MSPRLLKTDRCPHCKTDLPSPTPRVCPSCAGSLQRRFLSLGCLSSAPPIVLAALGLWAWAARDTPQAIPSAQPSPDLPTPAEGAPPLQCVPELLR